MSGHSISVIIPTIPPRRSLLKRAIESVEAQTHPAIEIITETDVNKEGPAVVRNRAAARAKGEWLAFLDDDDEMLPQHLETLVAAQVDSGADLVWPWFRVVGGTDPFPMHRGRQWDATDPHIFPITVLLRKSLFNLVEGFLPSRDHHPDGHETGEDFNLWLRLSEAGAWFHHVRDITWHWHHDSRNTSGLPSRW